MSEQDTNNEFEKKLLNDEIVNRTKRQEKIAEYLLQNSSVYVQELAKIFNVSSMTIHRDLDELEKQGILRKVRGGATAQPSSLFESDFRYRLDFARNAKLAIARFAIRYIEPGQAIMMDDSTTTLTLAELVKDIQPLTVITNSFPIIQELIQTKGIRLISLGGEYMPRYRAFTGMICEKAISSLRANLLLMSTSAVSDNIAFHQEQDIVKVKRAMMKSSARKILLIDHSKLHKIALHHLASLSEFDLVIVDGEVDSESLTILNEAKVKVEIAPINIDS